MNKERWTPVPGYERYFISACGRVWDTQRKVVMKPYHNEKGYLVIQLNPFNGSKRKLWKVHRVVKLAFDGPSEEQVDHINGIKTDNHLVNLEYVTAQENVLRWWRSGATQTQGSQNICNLCSV